jgi:hypothetical protein
MNVTLIKALVALLPAYLLLAYSFRTLMKAVPLALASRWSRRDV